MKLIVNGETLEAQASNLAALLTELGYEGAWIATAVNNEVVASGKREATPLADGDRIEVLTPRQGG
jgi:sulfur carrier protein